MPRLPKFKDYHISPLTGPMNSLTPLDLLNDKQFRYIKNFRVDGAGRLKRAGGFKALFDDGNYNVSGTIKNNSDLHDQLGSKQTPTNTTREPITLLYEFESGSGSRKLIAATKSRIYALNQRSRNWVLIGDNGGGGYAQGTSASFSTTKFKAAQLGNNIVFTNNYDQPLNWYFDANPKRADKNLVETIPDLVKLKITKAAHISEYKGFMFLADLEEATTQQVSKVQWSDYVDATSYYPSLASLAGQQTVGDIGERIIAMAVLGDHLMIYKERSIWRCSLVSSSNLFVFKQVYQGENTPFYEDTLVNTGDAHFFMSQAGIYRMTLASLRPQRVDWMHNASAIIFEDDKITGEDGTGPRHVTGGIKNLTEEQSGDIASLAACADRPPVISAHPGNLTINANPCSASYTSSANLTVALSSGAEPFSFQWQQKLTSASTWSDISGANNKNYVIKNPKAHDILNKQFRVLVSNSDVTSPVASNAATITLAGYSTVPSFTQHPEPHQIVYEGDTVVFEARWCTSGTSWQWKSEPSSGSGSNFTNVTVNGTTVIQEDGLVEPTNGATGYYFSKLTVKNVQASDNGIKYKINVVNPAGNTDSNEAALTITVAATDTTDGSSGTVTTTSGGPMSLFTVGSIYRDVLVLGKYGEVVGYHLDGKTSASGTWRPEKGLAQNLRLKPGRARGEVFQHKPFKVNAIGGTPDYTFRWYRNNLTSNIVTTAAVSSGNGVSVAVEKTGSKLTVGDLIKWSITVGGATSTKTLTLTADAEAGSTSLTGNLDGDLPSGASSYIHWNPATEQIISKFIDSTCDTVAHTNSTFTLSENSATATCNPADSNIVVGMAVTGSGIEAGTIVGEVSDDNTTITLSKESTVTGTQTSQALTFTTTTVTCNSSALIQVGQEVSGEGVNKGTTVSAVNSAGAVTQFTLSEPAASVLTNTSLTFIPAINKDYFQHQIKTKYNNDTSTLSFKAADIDSVTNSATVGIESIFRCIVTDSASSPASQTSNMFYINIWTEFADGTTI